MLTAFSGQIFEECYPVAEVSSANLPFEIRWRKECLRQCSAKSLPSRRTQECKALATEKVNLRVRHVPDPASVCRLKAIFGLVASPSPRLCTSRACSDSCSLPDKAARTLFFCLALFMSTICVMLPLNILQPLFFLTEDSEPVHI